MGIKQQKRTESSRYLLLGGIALIVLGFLASIIMLLETNGCKLEDVPELFQIGYHAFIESDYCGEISAFSSLPTTANYLISLFSDIFLKLMPVGFGLLIAGLALKMSRQKKS